MNLLDERQRRFVCRARVASDRAGGDEAVARATGMDPHTIALGRRELRARDRELERARRPGGGRPPRGKKTPEILAELERLMAPATAATPSRA